MLEEKKLKEIFIDIPNHEGSYQVSNKGRVKSLLFNKEKILKQSANSEGYLTVRLYKNKKGKTHNVHKLVAEAFLSPVKGKTQALHKNDIKTDNRLSNLYWGTISENMKDKFSNGYFFSKSTLKKMSEAKQGSKHPKAKLNEKAVRFIKDKHLYYKQKELAKIFKVSNSTISQIINGEKWSHV